MLSVEASYNLYTNRKHNLALFYLIYAYLPDINMLSFIEGVVFVSNLAFDVVCLMEVLSGLLLAVITTKTNYLSN
jgi:hypothetical protein